MNGIDNPVVFQDINEQVLSALEKFMQTKFSTDLLDEVDQYEPENYFGIFKNTPKKFCIVLGHRVLIQRFAQVCKGLYNKENVASVETTVSETVSGRTGSVESNLPTSTPLQTAQKKDADLVKTLFCNIASWYTNLKSLQVFCEM